VMVISARIVSSFFICFVVLVFCLQR